MDSWVGETCPYCHAPLKPDAAVVVCRVCGTPHHRECWAKNRGCMSPACFGQPVDALLTAEDRRELALDKPDPVTCPHCRAVIPPGNRFCGQCGASPSPRVRPRFPGIVRLIGGLLSSPPPATLPAPLYAVNLNPTDGAELVYIPAGEFPMGNPGGVGDDDEYPWHQVYLDAYYIYKNDVTVAQYRAFCAATDRVMPPGWPMFPGDKEDNCPMTVVTWDDAHAYADWAGAQLPTEAQWEKAARGTDERLYPWGNDWDSRNCACHENSVDVHGHGKGTHPVGSFPLGASPYGALDMVGNVFQWCADWYQRDYYVASPPSNPTGPVAGSVHVLRGSSWGYGGSLKHYFRCARRSGHYPAGCYAYIGFRCVVSAR